MHTGQMLTVLGALALLSLVSLSINTMIVGKTTTMLDAEAQLNAISIAQTMIDEIMIKNFDAATASGKVYNAADLTAAGGLGCSGAENSAVPRPDTYPYKSVAGYNDVDDYHRYTRIAVTPRMGNFIVTDTVYYVFESNPDAYSSDQTFFKKVVVTVRHPNMNSPLQLSDVAVYRRYF
jgi:hypothetical protein